ncbi:MAG: DUF1292 domain-containing protein [Lachnospiraceae bacterium]|nr:DUF1292 domain-containing protein [Lachnospiraceae bacterium]
MSDNNITKNEAADEMRVTLELDDGTTATCAIVTIMTIENQDYIALLPLEEDGAANKEGDVWFYRFTEDESDEDNDPILDFIEDDDEYERVSEAFDEFLDSMEFDEMDCCSEGNCPHGCCSE